MNERVQSLIREKQEEIREAKNKHLISLGLIDESRSKRVELVSYKEGSIFDPKKGLYIYDEKFPIELTDAEFIELCKYYPLNEVKYEADEIAKKTNEIARRTNEISERTNVIAARTNEDITNANTTVNKIKEDVRKIEFWIKLWSIVLIIYAAILLISWFL